MRWLGFCLAGLMATAVLADTLVCKDGRRLVGQVQEVDGGYWVRMPMGQVRVADYDVAQWIRGEEPASKAAATTTTPPSSEPALVGVRPPVRGPLVWPIPSLTGTEPASKPASMPVMEPVAESPATKPAPPASTPKPTTPSKPAINKPASTRPPKPPVAGDQHYAAAFPIAEDLLVTSAAVLEGATDLKLLGPDGFPLAVEVVKKDAASGLALLRAPKQKLPYLEVAEAFEGGGVVCPAFSEQEVFEARAQLLKGQTQVENNRLMVRLSKHPRLAGSPLMAGGRVVGVQLAAPTSPVHAIPAASARQLQALCDGVAGKVPRQLEDACGVMYQVAVTIRKPR